MLQLLKLKSSGTTATSATATLPRNSYNKVAYATGRRLNTKVPRRKAGVGAIANFTYLSIERLSGRAMGLPVRCLQASPGEQSTHPGREPHPWVAVA